MLVVRLAESISCRCNNPKDANVAVEGCTRSLCMSMRDASGSWSSESLQSQPHQVRVVMVGHTRVDSVVARACPVPISCSGPVATSRVSESRRARAQPFVLDFMLPRRGKQVLLA